MLKSARSAVTVCALTLLTSAVLAACSDIVSSDAPPAQLSRNAGKAQIMVECSASRLAMRVTCGNPAVPAGAQGVLLGGQNTYVKLTSSNVSYSSGTGIFQFDLTVQNLMNEAIGTPDGVVVDPEGIQVFFNSGPTVTGGSGTITVANPDGTGTFTAGGQPYFAYNQMLSKDEVSSAKTWQLNIPSSATSFTFTLLIETDVQYLLVINEVMANPAGTTADQVGEWFELYNAGTREVDLENLVIADSAASGRRPYHVIASSLKVQPGAYVVLGGSTNTTSNLGAPVDYSYGGALSIASSLDAIKISRVYGVGDTLTIDRTQFANASTSAQDGISRELKNPALDNSNMDGSNWAGASVTAVYGAGGRGTPGAQNSSFIPNLISSDPGPLLTGSGARAGPDRR